MLATSLASCSLAPPETLPPSPVAPAYKELGPWQPIAATPPEAGKWWTLFADPILNDLEARIEAANPDLAVAVARYDQARAALRETGAQALPSVEVGADADRSRISAGRPFGSGKAATDNDLRVGASLAYEIDLFGRVRNSIKASAADARASAQDLAAVRTRPAERRWPTIMCAMRGLDARITLLKQTVEAFQRAYDLTDTRHTGRHRLGHRRQPRLLDPVEREGRTVLGRRRPRRAGACRSRSWSANPRRASRWRWRRCRSAPGASRWACPPTCSSGAPTWSPQPRRVAAANARIGVARAAQYPSLTLGGVRRVRGRRQRHLQRAQRLLGARSALRRAVDLRRRRPSRPGEDQPRANMTRRRRAIARPC